MPWPADFSDDAELDISGNPVRNDLVARLDKIYDVLKALRSTLGLVPQGASVTVGARFDAANTALEEGLDALELSTSAALTALTDSADPFPTARYMQAASAGTSREFYVQATAPPTTGDDGAVWIDTSA